MDELRGPALVLTVGPAASGKSTVLRELIDRGCVDAVISTDAVRAELELPPAEKDVTYATSRYRVRSALAAGKVVAVDATNVRRDDRDTWRAVAAEHDATVAVLRVGVGLDLEQLVVRDAGRDRHVPADVIAEQLADAERCTSAALEAEGFAVLATAPAAVSAPVVGSGRLRDTRPRSSRFR